MEIKGTGFCLNVTTDGHGNSDWGAEIGQGKLKLMNVPGASEILNGMLYYRADELLVEAILGRGARIRRPLADYLPDTSTVLASVVQKVSVNGHILPGEKLIMFIIKDERKLDGHGSPNIHYQRRYLKFSDNATYDGAELNKNCIAAISKQLGCTATGSWIVTDMNFREDVLDLSAIVIDPTKPHDFAGKKDREDTIKRLKLAAAKPSTYIGDLSPVILYGPPGTGKTHAMQENYISHFAEENRFVTTFHQSFSYEEFVEGLKPVLDSPTDEPGDIKYTVFPGVFKEACEKAVEMAGYASLHDCVVDDPATRKAAIDQAIADKKLVLLCIDEINRGNIAAIFGELISLVEENKRLGAEREMKVTLPYSQEQFGVPANLLIVGTMNTADRSIQLLDSALRRRFQFREILPDYTVFKSKDPVIKPVLEKANKILQRINTRVRSLLNKDYQIGQSYLMFVRSEEDIFNAIVTKIIPLLEEYFYNDIAKVRFVLNENDKTKFRFYKEDKEAKDAFDSFVTEGDIEAEEKSFYKLDFEVKNAADCANYLKHLLGEPE